MEASPWSRFTSGSTLPNVTWNDLVIKGMPGHCESEAHMLNSLYVKYVSGPELNGCQKLLFRYNLTRSLVVINRQYSNNCPFWVSKMLLANVIEVLAVWSYSDIITSSCTKRSTTTRVYPKILLQWDTKCDTVILNSHKTMGLRSQGTLSDPPASQCWLGSSLGCAFTINMYLKHFLCLFPDLKQLF